ncbi:MAG: hypothetical protein FAZ92_01725 [Accumulibacter sp.]|uniref:6-hydroxymethylpterin diphosphokinase MptE-like protein n=1 Tax=Accumulibacter sp. TaxID=2053492 RepID=UPI00120D1254|nr:6-hydroxymethylpterin diphosphokinase MptE-like protein [Accumulibacter sp.]QKS30006.1 MAG: DUF115 domain-containing protein [Candidatus Accumulibacter similis]TLD46004.1 MAG: hypothetical protein FAZ92_01725 [Accumulibacter sp.]
MTVETVLSRLKDRHYDQRAVLVANGPSLNLMDLGFLRSETVIGVNKIFLGLKKFCFYPRYYIAVNQRVIAQSVLEIKAMTCVKMISRRDAELLPEDALTYHIETQNPPARFCRDISRGVHEGWTVTYAALQVAHYLGFKEVIIIGMDHRYLYTGAPNQACRLEGPDPNHFSPEYFRGLTWDNPDLAKSEESYRIARAEYERDGRSIVDATVNGACTVFQKADYRQVFGLPQ